MSLVTVIGAGRIAYSLCPALINAGYRDIHVNSRNILSARGLAKSYSIDSFSDCLEKIPEDSRIYILAVPDSFIAATAQKLAPLIKRPSGKIFLHLSGALCSDVLLPLKNTGAETASLHIMQSFPQRLPVPLENCPAAIETDSDIVFSELMSLCMELKLIPFRLLSAQKAVYHTIGVYLSNFFISNLEAANDLFGSIKLEGIGFWDIFLPIIKSTLGNAQSSGIVNSLSGPAERADFATIKKHLECLKENPLTENLQFDYAAKTIQTLKVAQKKNPEQMAAYLEIEKYLLDLIKKKAPSAKPGMGAN